MLRWGLMKSEDCTLTTQDWVHWGIPALSLVLAGLGYAYFRWAAGRLDVEHPKR